MIVPHRAVSRLVINNGYTQIESSDCFAHCSNPAFDASTFEIWGALLNGAKLVLYDRPHMDIRRIESIIEENGVSILWLSAGLFNQLTDTSPSIFEPVKQLRLVILDACRDNPFVKKMKRTVATRAIGQGLAKVEPASSDTLIAFAAKAGSIANDGEGPHSPFTTALLKHLPSPAVDVRLVFGRVRDDVLASTRGKQEPFMYGSLGGSDVALVPAPVAPAPGAAVDARHDYELAERVGTIPAWDAFLARYATGFYANLAREQRSKLLQAQAARQQVDQEASRKRDDEERKLLATRPKTEADGKRQREDEERRARAAERERAGREKAEREKAERDKAEELARIEREKAEQERARREEIARAEEERRAREQTEREKSAAAKPGKTRTAMLPPATEPVGRPQPPHSSKSGNAKKPVRPAKKSTRNPTKPREKTRTTSNQTSSSSGEVCIVGPGYVHGRFRGNAQNGRRCFHR